MTVLEPAKSARVAQELREELAALTVAHAAEQGPPVASKAAFARYFAHLAHLGPDLGSTWFVSLANAAQQALDRLDDDEPFSVSTEVTVNRVVRSLATALDGVARGDGPDAHEADLRVATAMLSAIEDEPQDSLSDLDLFVGSAVRELELARHALDRLAADPTDRAAIDAAFRAVHTVRGDAGVMDAGGVEAACSRLETVLEALRCGEAVATGSVVDACNELVTHAIDAVLEPGAAVDVSTLDSLTRSLDEGRSLAKATRLGELLVDQQMVDEHDIELALAIKSGPVGRTLVNLRVIADEDLDRVLELQKELRREGAVRSRKGPAHVKRVSVSEDTLLALTRAVRELQSRVVDLPTIPLMHEVATLTDKLQQQPMGSVFRKLARAARALADELGKEVWVSVSGGHVEVHREIVQALDGPLLHLVRNALDHGIEKPAQRRVAGKPARATLTLSAVVDGPALVVEVGDDGAGIDVSRILQRAIDMGIVSEQDGLAMADNEIERLIFRPGLSGSATVGRISGRGVGMDVVEHSVTSLGGTIALESHRGVGTRFRIEVPLRR